jgi:hypothetical protein
MRRKFESLMSGQSGGGVRGLIALPVAAAFALTRFRGQAADAGDSLLNDWLLTQR